MDGAVLMHFCSPPGALQCLAGVTAPRPVQRGCGEIRNGLKARELVISRTPFIVVYRVRPRAKRIELIRLLHGSQQGPLQRRR